MELQTIRDDHDSQNQSRLEHRRDGRGSNHNVALPGQSRPSHAMNGVDSYEIYGENQEDSEVDEEGNPRPQARPTRHSHHNKEAMVSGEQVIEPSKMKKAEFNRQVDSGTQAPRRANRDSSSVKKTNIEVLDHETPIEQYQQYYNQ
mmetsp:Transcript_16056/g.24917  ORF Transcript_16056/g.24917 Transcript_16056/m.24917 type:complete len:146 (-) Transcript_16056:1368-1805(-)